VIVEIHGLEIFGRHGVGDEERRDGQPFLFDVTLEVAEPDEDAIGATVDYRAVRDTVRASSDECSYRLLETLAGAAADAIVAAFPVESATVRVRKPGVAWADWTAATASRARPSSR
jgi:7,8-dihydroneopterin aldolase/epimerase/oxygenase